MIGATRLLTVMATCWFLAAIAQAQYFPDDRNSCRSCHVDARNKTDFCELFEATIYERDDKHARAFSLLVERGPLVRQILGFELNEAFVDDRYSKLKEPTDEKTIRQVATVKACLRCHATWPAAADAQSPSQPPVALELGVSCQACHGPGIRWNLPHYLPPHTWRVITPEAKTALGFVDVRSPATKARLCASCHVGNVQEGKLVKHEWYAGGHPPLPSFELASFAAQMPVHWRPLAAKPNFALREGAIARTDTAIAGSLRILKDAGIPEGAVRDNYVEANYVRAPHAAAALPRTKDTTVAGAAMLEAYVRLIGDYGAAATSANAENKAWPELALYDCTACHHELRSGLGLNSRPKRNGAPGRPPLLTWPTALAQLAAHQATGFDEAQAEARWSLIRGQLLQLELATTSRPFGDPAAMHRAADTLARTLAALASDAASSRYDMTAARQSLRFLSNPDRVETNDFATARQVAWSIREIATDLDTRDADRWFLSDGDDSLALTLPSGPNHSVIENLNRWLSAATHYDPAIFRQQLQSIRADGRLLTP
jgi:hypothetical protein